MIEVLLADEQKMFAQMIQSGMKTFGINIEIADTLEGINDLYHKVNPDVVVLDARFNEQDSSLEFCRRLLENCPGARIVILSQCDGDYVIKEFYSAGVLAYVCKKDDIESLVKAIESASRGEDYYPPGIAQKLARIAHKTSPFPFLSDKEKEIFVLMAKGYSLTEISKLVEMSLSKVNKTSAKIKKNLGVERSWDLAKIALRYQILNVDQ